MLPHISLIWKSSSGRGSGVSNYIESDQSFAPYHLVFLSNGTKKRFPTNWFRDKNGQGVHEQRKIWKNFTVS